MPALLVATPEDPAMVAVTSRGYAITRRGLEELERRGIPHRGEEVVAEGGQRLDFGDWDPETYGGDEEAAAVPQAVVKALPAPVPLSMPSFPVIVPPPAAAPSPPVITPPAAPPAQRTLSQVTADIKRLLDEI